MGPLPRRPQGRAVLASAASAVLILFASSILTACNQAAPQPPAPQAMPVTVRVVAPTNAPVFLEAVAQTEGVREVEVRARVGGILEKRLYTEGAAVKEGQPLYQIDKVPFEIALAQARAQLVEQQAKAAQAQREAARLQGLVGDEAISRKEYDDAVSNLAVSKAAVAAAQAAMRDAERNLSYSTVTAPVAGTTSRSVRSEGSLVSTSDGLLTTIVQLDPIRVRFSLAQGDLARFSGGRPSGATKVEMILPDGSTYPQPGKLDFAASRIDPALGTLELRAEFPNPNGGILPGEFVRARLTAATRQNIFLVPQAAVMQTDQGRMVMLIGQDGKVAPRPVQAAEWVGQDWVITEGLQAGDKVIVDNLIKLRPGMAVVEKTAEQPAAPGAPQAEKPKA